MNAEVFAEWLHRQGHQTVRTDSTFWCEQGPRIWQAFPYHWQITPQPVELCELIRGQRAIGLRYSAPLATPMGKASYHVVLERCHYSLASLPKKARHDVRKAERSGAVGPITFAQLAGAGWQLRQATLARQGRSGAETSAWWRSLCSSAADLPGFETWGVLVEGELAASLLAFTCEGCCSILYQQSQTAALGLGVNNLLTFAFTETVMQRAGIESIFYGLHSLDAPASVDEFKFRMGYTARPVRQRVVFHPWLAPLFNGASHALLRRLLRVRPASPALAKAEGMVRFYREGQRPLAAQTWPAALRAERGE